MTILHKPAPRTLPGGNPLLVLLHGYGSHEGDLFGLADHLDDRLAIAALRAPIALPWGGHAWFNIEVTPQGMKRDLAQAHHAIDGLADALGALLREHAPAQLIVGGFSQGAMMAASLALKHPQLAQALVLMSGRLLEPPTRPLSVGLPPAIVVHGTQDEVIPIKDGREFSSRLQMVGMAVDYHEYPMGHTISEDSLEAVNTWLTTRI